MTTRKSIKEKITEIIKGKTDAGESVFASRSIPTDINDLPVVLIYFKNEGVEIFDESPRRYKRVANFTVECIVSGNDDNDASNKSEDLLSQVEDSLAIDETLGCLVSDSWLGNVQFQSEPDGQSPIAATVLTYNVKYFKNSSPKDDAPDYLRSNVGWQVGHHDESSDETIDAEDLFDIPQG